jgi:hypothetical protein
MKEILICAAETQLNHLEEVDAEELGEVIDMIKDLEETEYYCSVVKAMEEHKDPVDKMYYSTPTSWNHENHRPIKTENGWVCECTQKTPHYYTEKEFPRAFDDPREGRSYRSRRMYMETKETHQDKTVQMKELEKYLQELGTDITEMIEGATPEERQFMSQKMSALATKILQTSTTNA